MNCSCQTLAKSSLFQTPNRYALISVLRVKHVLHKKFRFRCATFFKADKFQVERESHKDRILVTTLRSIGSGKMLYVTPQPPSWLLPLHACFILLIFSCVPSGPSDAPRPRNVINCHLSGGAAPDKRLRQVHAALEQIKKWRDKAASALTTQKNAKRPSAKNIAQAEEMLQSEDQAAVIVCGDFNSDGGM